MPFLDKVSKTVSDVGQKTKDTADIARLNSKISENDRQINQLYTKIGEIYFNLYSENPGEDFVPDVTEVLNLKAQNEEFNDQIQQLKGFVKCPCCGEYIANTERVCPHCGQSLLPDNLMICPSCNATVEKTNSFCPYCGTRLSVAQPEAVTEDKPVTKIICTCGTEVDEGMAFCPNCGTRIADLIAVKEVPANNQDA